MKIFSKKVKTLALSNFPLDTNIFCKSGALSAVY